QHFHAQIHRMLERRQGVFRPVHGAAAMGGDLRTLGMAGGIGLRLHARRQGHQQGGGEDQGLVHGWVLRESQPGARARPALSKPAMVRGECCGGMTIVERTRAIPARVPHTYPSETMLPSTRVTVRSHCSDRRGSWVTTSTA